MDEQSHAPDTAAGYSSDDAPIVVGQNLEVDSDSAYGGTDSDATSSYEILNNLKASGVLRKDYRFEHGRRYHSDVSGEYWLPNDEREVERLDLQHVCWKMTLNGSLHLAPLKTRSLREVLDIGTGNGNWAIEFADEYPGAQVLGTDLSPIQPPFVPVNCSFLIDNVESEWLFGSNHFDYIHSRMLVMGMHDWPKFLRQAYDALRPGGWIELQELTATARCADSSASEDSPLLDWSRHIISAATKMGLDPFANEHFSHWLREAGFECIREEAVKWPIGTWPKNSFWKRHGALTLENFSMGMEGISLALFTRVLGWSREELELYLLGVRTDLRDQRKHFYFPVTVHIARKPYDSNDEISPDSPPDIEARVARSTNASRSASPPDVKVSAIWQPIEQTTEQPMPFGAQNQSNEAQGILHQPMQYQPIHGHPMEFQMQTQPVEAPPVEHAPIQHQLMKHQSPEHQSTDHQPLEYQPTASQSMECQSEERVEDKTYQERENFNDRASI